MENIRVLIEKRAYHLFLKRGGLHGYHMEDWIRAEKEVTDELAAKKKAEVKQPSAFKAAPKPEAVVQAPAVPAAQAQRASWSAKPAPRVVKKGR
jgi:hypothetical protein